MAHWLTALADLPKDQGSSPGTYMVAQNHL